MSALKGESDLFEALRPNLDGSPPKLDAIVHALKALDPPKRKRDPIGTATLTMDEVDLVARYSYQRQPEGYDVFDVKLTVKPNEALLDAVRDEISFRLRQEDEQAAADRADDGPEYEPDYDAWHAKRMARAADAMGDL